MKASGSLAILSLVALSGCTTGTMVDFAMQSAPRPAAHRGAHVGNYEILAGDLHCHVLPPDPTWHVTRDLRHTVALAKKQGLDFVVLTPHVGSRFYMNEEERDWVRSTQADLRASIAQISSGGGSGGGSDVVLIPGMEYTDGRFGHVGIAFAEVTDVLDEVSTDEAIAHPERFFERWLAHGGTMTINHPVLRPLARSPFKQLRGDLTWRGFGPQRTDVPPEIAWITEHAQAVETYNLSIGHLRDQFLIGDEDRSLRESAHLVDREAREQERTIAAVGGTDSHGAYLRGTTWLLASARTKDAIREAIVAGRTCVRGPEACTLEASVPSSGEWVTVGSALRTSTSSIPLRGATPAFGGSSTTPNAAAAIDVRARGGTATYFVNGAIAGAGRDGETVRLGVPGRCALVRAVVGRSWSSAIYVDCPWAPGGNVRR